MTDQDLVAKKLAEIETFVRELRELGNPDAIQTDLRERRFIERTLVMAMQAALDAASHIVSDERLGEPDTNRELFVHLERNGWIPSDLSKRLQNMAGMRNILVHAYGEVDLDIIAAVVRDNLDDLLAFAQGIRARLNQG